MKKTLLLYTLIIGISVALTVLLLQVGTTQFDNTTISNTQPASFSIEQYTKQLVDNYHHPFSTLLLQIIIILIVSKFFGYLFSKMSQPSVIGEIIAGIALGPSILGHIHPELLTTLFPAKSISHLQFISQIGLTFFMFLVGMELDAQKIKSKAKEALIISHSSIVVPFLLGVLLSLYIFDRFVPENTSFLIFALFMGTAMSITAFPVLARIVRERNLSNTPLGIMAISCAAADDLTAWCVLALVVALAKAGTFISALYTIIPAILYICTMFLVVRPFLKKIIEKNDNQHQINKTIIALIFLVLLGSSLIAELIGIHFLFGAFIAGLIMPDGIRIKELLSEKVEDISLIIFLPIFFAVTGLRTEIPMVNDSTLWPICFLIIGVAVVGKFLGSSVSAKLTGQNWQNALSIGALMNTRGLMELVVLNIGFDLGIISKDLFSMMVLMSLVTTFMTTPALKAIDYFFAKKQ